MFPYIKLWRTVNNEINTQYKRELDTTHTIMEVRDKGWSIKNEIHDMPDLNLVKKLLFWNKKFIMSSLKSQSRASSL